MKMKKIEKSNSASKFLSSRTNCCCYIGALSNEALVNVFIKLYDYVHVKPVFINISVLTWSLLMNAHSAGSSEASGNTVSRFIQVCLLHQNYSCHLCWDH